MAMTSTVKVWDRPIRLFHWSLAGSVALCWLTADELQSLHEVAGYAAAGLI
ncbi:cytochrome B, partial [Sinorhizobium medicae]